MFTGIISNTTHILQTEPVEDGLKVRFERPGDWGDLQLGESIATDGVCLTVASLNEKEYECILIKETLEKTKFGTDIPAHVNLERAMKLNDRLSGHIVQGHVDDVGSIQKITKDDGWRIYITFASQFIPLVITKGSIAVDGVSLTIVAINANSFSVALVPHTLQHTTLGSLAEGSKVNLEFDVIGKYITHLADKKT